MPAGLASHPWHERLPALRVRRPPSRPATMAELERLVRRAAAAHLGGAAITLLSTAHAGDDSYVEIECAVAAASADRLDRAAAAIAASLDPMLAGAGDGAAVRVRFAVDPLI